MTEEQAPYLSEDGKQYIYVEPMGHGNHFVAEIAPSSLVPGSVQLNVLRGDGTVERTIGMTGTAIFRWTSVSRENALILAQQIESHRTIYNVSVPERLLLEAQSAQRELPPAEREQPNDYERNDDEDDCDDEGDDEDDEDDDPGF